MQLTESKKQKLRGLHTQLLNAQRDRTQARKILAEIGKLVPHSTLEDATSISGKTWDSYAQPGFKFNPALDTIKRALRGIEELAK